MLPCWHSTRARQKALQRQGLTLETADIYLLSGYLGAVFGDKSHGLGQSPFRAGLAVRQPLL